VSELLADCDRAIEYGDLDFAGHGLLKVLSQDPTNHEAWTTLARFLIDAGKAPYAYPIAVAAVSESKTWRNLLLLGSVQAVLQEASEACKTLHQALDLMPENEPDSNKAIVYRQLASAYVQGYNFKKTKHYANLSLKLEDHHQPKTSLAFAALHERDWELGWKLYRSQLGTTTQRELQDYGLPEWKGEKDASVLVYGEQGLGDQIAYMSACPITPSQIVCNPKLETLFSLSFPFSDVHGAQFSDFKGRVKATHQISRASFMPYAEMKQRGKFLKPRRQKEIQWAGLLSAQGHNKPKIGIAWTGGAIKSDGWKNRNLTLHDLKPILELDATFVSLEYKDRTEEIDQFKKETGITIHDWPWGSMSNNYDDQAALVNCLDMVVSVPTTIYHLAGALGKPAMVLVHDQPHFHEGIAGDCPWWESVKFYRRPELGTENAVLAVRDSIINSLRDTRTGEVKVG